MRSGAEEGSSPVVTFGNGPRHPFWQISMVPIEGDPERVEAEVLVLGPAAVDAPPAPPPRRPRAAAKAKAKRG